MTTAINQILESAQPQKIEIDDNNLKQIKAAALVAFSYAESGAMGEKGQFTVAQLENGDLQFYHTNLFRNEDKFVNTVISTCFQPFANNLEEFYDLGLVHGWEEFGLGYGNYLFIRKASAREFKAFCSSIDLYMLASRALIYKNHQAMLNVFFSQKFVQEKALCLLRKPTLLGGIIGDIVGSRFEFKPIKTKQFDLFYSYSGTPYSEKQTVKDYMESSHFTDDTIMTLAVAKSLLDAHGKYDHLRELVVKNMKDFGQRYPFRGYGARFDQWLRSKSTAPYNSLGNGAAMRISAVAYFGNYLQHVKELSQMVTDVTHNHPEGIKGAEATAVAIWLALHGSTKDEIKQEIEKNYYQLDFDYDDLVENYHHIETCQDSVPQAIYAFLISESYEDALRIAVSMGGDADTMACIAGSIAGAYYGIPNAIRAEAWQYLPDEFKAIITEFENHFA